MRFLLLSAILLQLSQNTFCQEIDLHLPKEVENETEWARGLIYDGMGLGVIGGAIALSSFGAKVPSRKKALIITGSSIAGAGVLVMFSAAIPIEKLRKKNRKLQNQ